MPTEISVDSHRFYREYSNLQQEYYFRFINSETIPMRASIADFDLDPPLTHKGLKDAFHTGKSIEYFPSISYPFSHP